MGLSSTQVSEEDDQMFDWSNTLQQPPRGEAEAPEEPPHTRRQKRLQKQETMPPLKCPRCDSTNTKFCYYNNYNKSQPRHLCKTCKRHWTNGGTLRNVPIGGRCKNKRLKTTTTATGTTTSTSTTTTTSIALLPVQDTEFLSTSLSSLKRNSLINLSSYDQSLNGYDNYMMHTMEGSTITTAIPSMNASTELEIPNYWNWNEFDELISTHDLNLDWYDTELSNPNGLLPPVLD